MVDLSVVIARLVVVLVVGLIAGCVDLSPVSVTELRDAPGRDVPAADALEVAGPPAPDAPLEMAPGDVVLGNEDGADTSLPDGLEPPDLPPELPLVLNGSPCAQNSQCASNVCANGVCCNQACTEPCHACNLPAALGTCTPVPAGDDPGGHCAQSDVATCGLDGSCNGAGACRQYPVDTQCGPGTCMDAIELSARTCDGAGTCRPVAASRSCSPGICMGNSCASTCSQQSQCLAGFFCDGSRCAGKRATGTACTMSFECMTGQCVDGFCCNSQCGEMCNACNVAGAQGTCTAVPTGQDPRNQCPAEIGGCGRAGGCNGSGACRLQPMGTSCGATSCNGNTETSAGVCNGLGVCGPNFVRSCAPYYCAGAACATSCSTNNDCAPGYQCNSSACARASNLALYWRFEEVSGTSALDSSGNGYLGQYVGPPTPASLFPTLMYPNAFSRAFVMANRHAVVLSDAPAALKPANNLTISVWFRTSSVDENGGTPIGSELVSMSNKYLIRLRPDGLEAVKRTNDSGDSVQCRSQGALPAVFDNNWHHAAAVFGSSEGTRLYFDGVVRACRDGSAGGNTTNINYDAGDDLFVGRHGSGETQWDFGGNLDEIRIYTRALSAVEVAALAQGRN